MCRCSSIQRKKPPEGCKSKQIEKKVMRQLLGDRGKQSKSIKSLVKCLLSHRVSTKSVSINNWEVRSLCGFRFIILRYSCVCCVDSPPARSTEKWLADRSSCHSCFSSSALKQRWWCLYDTSPGRRRGGRAGAEPMERWEERKGREVERGVVFFLKKRSGDGKLWHIDRSWTTTTVRPAGQTEREVKSRRAHTPPPPRKKLFSWICGDSSNSNTSGGNHLCLQASHYRSRVWDCSDKTLSLASRPARDQHASPHSLLHTSSPPPLLLPHSFYFHHTLFCDFIVFFIFFIIRSDLLYSLYADCISCLAQFSQCLTVSHYKKSEICLFTCEIHCLKCVDSHLKIASNMWNCDFHTLAIFKGEPKIINMWILLLHIITCELKL